MGLVAVPGAWWLCLVHLSGKEGKKHAYYKTIAIDVTEKLASRGYTLQSEDK